MDDHITEDSFEMNLKYATGEMVTIIIYYPKDRGIIALQALVSAGSAKRMEQLVGILRDDPSVHEAAAEYGYTIKGEEVEDV